MLSKELENENIQSLSFADDLLINCHGLEELDRGLRIILNWSEKHKLSVNKKKSGIIAVRVDRRTPMPKLRSIAGIDIVEEYKYLGVQVSDDVSVRSNNSNLSKKLKVLNKKLKLQWAFKLPEDIRYLAWKSLLESKFMYA